MWPAPFGCVYTHPWAWIPEDGIQERSRRDNVRYEQWVRSGYIETTPGNVTDWRFVTARIKQLAQIFDIRRIGFDRYGARDTVSDLQDDGIDVVDVGQGFASMSPGTKRLEQLVLSRKIVHCGNPVDRWCMDCTTITSDPAGNIKPVKPQRQMTSKRIDITVARVIAIDCMMRAEPQFINPVVWSVGA